jgi:hypothetical protein
MVPTATQFTLCACIFHREVTDMVVLYVALEYV